MILQALTRYYEILSSDPLSDIAPSGYSAQNISFALNISIDGELLDIFPLFDQVMRGRKLVDIPRRMLVPEQVKRSSGISPNFLWDNAVYVLGLSDKDAKDPDYAAKRFKEFRIWNKQILGDVNSPAAKAVIAFLDKFDPGKGMKHPKISSHLDTILKGANLVFKFNDGYVHEDPAIKKAWEKHKSHSESSIGQCLITGDEGSIARLHPSIKGIRGANSTGASLVSFNERAYESYNKEKGQGLNSPISEKAAFAYTTALNHLLSSANENGKIYLGDTTVIYWAEDENPGYAKAFAGLFEPEVVDVETNPPVASQPKRNRKAETRLQQVAQRVRHVQALDIRKLLDGLDGNPRFYILGLAPNAARISVRFFHSDPFHRVVDRIMQHYRDMEIIKEYEDQPTYLTVRHIINETISKKSSDPQASPLLAGAVFRAILGTAPYPAALYNAIITRTRADMDDKNKNIRKINYPRAAIIKAFLLRKYRNQPQNPIQEVLTMSLNEKATQPAYVLGRLFAVLEKVQQQAIGDVNASIKDRYFTSACASPASVFPILLRLSQHHIAKADYGYASDRRIQDILNLLDIKKNPIPSRLSLDEQGVFILGYYHQRAAFYIKTNSEPIQSTGTK